MQPLLINAAITSAASDGAEVVAEVERCCASGAAIVQVDLAEDSLPPRREAVAELLAAIRTQHPDAIVSLAASGRPELSLAQRVQVVALRPEVAVLALSAEGPRAGALHAPNEIRALALAMQHQGVAAELKLADVGMAEYVPYLRRRGLLRGPLYAQILLGVPGGMSATAENLCAIVRALPPETIWSAGAPEPKQFFVNSLAVVMGGHVRVATDGTSDGTSPSLAAQIERIATLARAAGRSLATPDEARQLLGLATSHDLPGRRAAA